MMKNYDDDEEEFDDYTPTSWERQDDETDEDYEERTQDQEDWLESFDD
ncbi:hypothetical protein HPS57_10275 [Prevotella sp. PINT]|jgi:hypothetical protein|nr:hypothetical protein [Palleniella intestinalis]NPD82353.1 hypothetical protein [Palleniella intestinalis]